MSTGRGPVVDLLLLALALLPFRRLASPWR